MADITELSYRELAWCSTWYLREDTLKTAIAQIVTYQHRLALAQFWGGGTLSSSEAQRFPLPV
jgi:TnpA family transposase